MGRIVVDPYYVQSPIGEGIAKIGQALLSGPNPVEMDYYRARTENSRLESDKIRREFEGRDKIAGLAGNQNFDPAQFAAIRAEAIRTGDWSKLGEVLRAIGYTQNGTPQNVRDSVFMAAGGPASGTETGHAKTLGTQVQIAGMHEGGENARNAARIASSEKLAEMADARTAMPVMLQGANGLPFLAMRPKSQVTSPVFAGTPVLPKDLYSPSPGADGSFKLQPNVPGLKVQPTGGTLRNVQRPDGSVTMSSDPTGRFDVYNRPIPEGSTVYSTTTPDTGNTEMAGLRTSNQNLDLLTQNITDLLAKVQQSPASVGAVGNVREFLQNALQQGQLAAGFFSPEAIAAVRDQVSRIDPALASSFDPNLPQIDLLRNLIAYRYMTEIYGQPGHSGSNKDFSRALSAIGGENWLANPAELQARMFQVQKEIATKKGMNDRRLNQRGAPAGAPATGGGGGGVMRFDPITGKLE